MVEVVNKQPVATPEDRGRRRERDPRKGVGKNERDGQKSSSMRKST